MKKKCTLPKYKTYKMFSLTIFHSLNQLQVYLYKVSNVVYKNKNQYCLYAKLLPSYFNLKVLILLKYLTELIKYKNIVYHIMFITKILQNI